MVPHDTEPVTRRAGLLDSVLATTAAAVIIMLSSLVLNRGNHFLPLRSLPACPFPWWEGYSPAEFSVFLADEWRDFIFFLPASVHFLNYQKVVYPIPMLATAIVYNSIQKIIFKWESTHCHPMSFK